MRVALLAPRLHFHAPFVLRALIPRARSGEDRYLVVTTPKLPAKPGPVWVKLARLWRVSGPDYLLAMARAGVLELARGALERLLRRPPLARRSLSVDEACRFLGAEVARARSVAEPALHARIAAFRPDLLCAVFFNQIVPPSLRAVAPLGAINVHPSPLPLYRGISPCFWALARGEASSGVTIHRLTGEIDRGPILAQARVEIDPLDSLLTLYRRCAVRGGDLLAGLLSDPLIARRLGLEEAEAAPGPASRGEGSSFGSVTRAAVRQFRGRGRSFL